jgi:hypothetical protein
MPFPESDIELVQVHRQDIGSLLDHWAERRPDHRASSDNRGKERAVRGSTAGSATASGSTKQ